jgi:hypothetical protein
LCAAFSLVLQNNASLLCFPCLFLQTGVLCNEKFQKQFPDFPEVTTNSGGTVEALFFFSSMWKDVEDLWDAVQ